MSSVQHLREFISQRLTAAAQEIFTEFEKTIVHYEDEIDRQRRLPESCWKAQILVPTAEAPQQHADLEQKVLEEQLLSGQERSCSLDQQEAEAAHIQEEGSEACSSQEEEQRVQRKETDTLMIPQSKAEPGETVCTPNVVQHEDHVDPLHRLLDLSRKPVVKLHRIDFAFLGVPKKEKEEVLIHEQPNRKRNLSQPQEEAQPTGELPELCGSREAEEPAPKREKTPTVTPADEESNPSDPDVDADALPSPCPSADQEEAEADTHTCQTCGERFSDLLSFQVHLIDHKVGKRAYVCDTCGKTLKSSQALKYHKVTHIERKPYHCQVCGKGFNRKKDTYNHMETHIVLNPFLCELCGIRYEKETHLNHHMKRHTTQNPFDTFANATGERSSPTDPEPNTDALPPLMSGSDANQKDGMPKQQENNIYHVKVEDTPLPESLCIVTHICETCGKKCSDLSEFKMHLTIHAVDKKFYVCDTCGKRFGNSTSLERHKTTHIEKKPYDCRVCGKGFDDDQDMLVHVETHAADKQYLCEKCGLLYEDEALLSHHMKSHTTAKPIYILYFPPGGKSHIVPTPNNVVLPFLQSGLHRNQEVGMPKRQENNILFVKVGNTPLPKSLCQVTHICETCGNRFSDLIEFKRHLTIHPVEKKTDACNTCGKILSNSHSLRRHMLVHSSVKPHLCSTCGKSFKQKHSLKKHMNVHHGEKPHRCENCGEHFALSSDLTLHIKSHTELSCKKCGKIFSRKSALIQHMKTHRKIKRHMCRKCGKVFLFRRTAMKCMISHLSTVVKKRQLSCAICRKTFLSKNRIMTHMKTHTQQWYSCPICGTTFLYEKILQKHMRTHTDEDLPESSLISYQ